MYEPIYEKLECLLKTDSSILKMCDLKLLNQLKKSFIKRALDVRTYFCSLQKDVCYFKQRHLPEWVLPFFSLIARLTTNSQNFHNNYFCLQRSYGHTESNMVCYTPDSLRLWSNKDKYKAFETSKAYLSGSS